MGDLNKCIIIDSVGSIEKVPVHGNNQALITYFFYRDRLLAP